MKTYDKIYINGEWVSPVTPDFVNLINPATGKVSGKVVRANEKDVSLAVKAAKEAFKNFSNATKEERIAYLRAFANEYQKQMEEVKQAVTMDIGSPKSFNEMLHGPGGLAAINSSIEALEEIELETKHGKTLIIREPIGVAALIAAWNWPSMMITVKVSAALAAGCTIVLKPAELGTHTAVKMAEMLDTINLPKGVFNMVLGSGSKIGNALTQHPDVDFVSFTGSEGVGIQIAENAADTVKKLGLELGGKSAFIVLPDSDISQVAQMAVMAVMLNSGQMCAAASRTLVPASIHDEFVQAMKTAVNHLKVGDPFGDADIGPVVSQKQWETIQYYIQSGIDEGADLVVGGTGKPENLPEGFEQGTYIKPTVFGNANNQMKIAREEIFGPVATVIPYKTVDDAIEIANDSPYGLSGYVFGPNNQEALDVAKQLRTGFVFVNQLEMDPGAPWGGYKTSGIGRENGIWGIEEMLEIKAISSNE